MDAPDDIKRLPPDTPWLEDADTQAVCRAISDRGAQVYFVGGCVRDAILGIKGSDTDLSTDALPQDVSDYTQAAGLRAVPTGIDHGTVTVVSGGKGFEITTFRRDIETDGRRARVSFSKNIIDDAKRRDFTMNALYATPLGAIIDPLGKGLRDCLNRRVRFIDDATQRIQEDYLRILRYFRFHAWYARPEDGFDADALCAIASNADGLEKLSAERVGAEIKRLLAAPDPAPAVAAMRQTGCLAVLLPGADDRFLAPVCHLETMVPAAPDAILRLAALGGEDAAQRLRLSKTDQRYLATLSETAYSSMSLGEISYRHDEKTAQGAAILRAAMAAQPLGPDVADEISAGAKAQFPVAARDLMPELSGKALGEKLAQLERLWIASGFTLQHEELMTK